MARTESTMLDLGTTMPDFTAKDVRTGSAVTAETLRGTPSVVMFICNHCPFVKHLHEGLTSFDKDYAGKDVHIVAISSNDVESHPDDSPQEMKSLADELGWSMSYCYDESQEAAKAFRAACTPDFFVFDGSGALVYRGQFDASRPGGDEPVTGADLRAAVDAVLAGSPVPADQKPSIGCNIKWKAGNAPEYFASA